jgi:DNA (cytosine-5)-methyltransferase 1
MFRTGFANELLPIAADTYARNMKMKVVGIEGHRTSAEPKSVMVGDVTRLEFDDAPIDLVIGGPPCQDFSIVRGPSAERRGIHVKRGKLFSHFVRALARIQPRAFVFENVPGIVSANKGIAFEVIRKDLTHLDSAWKAIREELGQNNNRTIEPYTIIFEGIVDFSKLGVPQARRRMIIIGVRNDLSRALSKEELGSIRMRTSTLLSGRSSTVGTYPLTPLEVFEGRVLTELSQQYSEVMREYEQVTKEIQTERAMKWRENVWERITLDATNDYLMANKVGPLGFERAIKEHKGVLKELGYLGKNVLSIHPKDHSNDRHQEDKIQERMRHIPPGENHEFVRGTKWQVEGRGMSLIYRRLSPLKPSYTVVAYGGGGTWGYHYDRERATLTNRERARLQSFPDEFLFSGTRSEVRTQIGEAVPPLGAKRIAAAVESILRLT